MLTNLASQCSSCGAEVRTREDAPSEEVLCAACRQTKTAPGQWYRQIAAGGVAGVSQRSKGEAAGALALALFVNAILAVFVLLMTMQTYRTAGEPIPAWMPHLIRHGEPMTVATVVGLWIFLLPFLALGLMTIGQLLTGWCGFTEVRIHGRKGQIHRGWGPVGWNRMFDAESIREVRIETGKSRISSARMDYLILETRDGHRIRFGQTLTLEQQTFLLTALRRMLSGPLAGNESRDHHSC